MASGQNAAPNFVDQQLAYEQGGLTSYGDPDTTNLTVPGSTAVSSPGPVNSLPASGLVSNANATVVNNIGNQIGFLFFGQYFGNKNSNRNYLAIQNQDPTNYLFYLPNNNSQQSVLAPGAIVGYGNGVAIPPGQLYELNAVPLNFFSLYFIITTVSVLSNYAKGFVIEGSY